MNKLKSARLNLVKFLFVLPFVAVMLLAFRGKRNPPASGIHFWLTGMVIEAGSGMPLDNVMIRDAVSGRSIATDKNGYFKIGLPAKDGSIKVSANFSLEGYETALLEMNDPNPGAYTANIDFVYLHHRGEKGPKISVQSYTGEPQYSVVAEKLRQHQQQKSMQEKIDKMVGNSTHPIWIVDGVPYAVMNDGKGGKGYAWFDGNDLEDAHEFRVLVDGKLMTMEETNNTISRFNLDGVGALSRSEARSTYGINYNLLVLKSTPAGTVRRSGLRFEECH